ncbi:type II secretion system F family protein [Agromyces soli]
MSALLGALLGVGLLLAFSPWLWPAASAREPRRHAMGDRVRDELALAGLAQVPLLVIVVSCGVLALLAGAIALAVFGIPVLAVTAGVLGGAVIPMVVRTRALRRRVANRALWPDVVDHLVASVRAGMSLPEATAALAELGPPPMRTAFAAFAADLRRGAGFQSGLDALKQRLADPTADRIVETLRMAREVGGTELPVVLRSLSGYLREDAALRAEVRARQSWIRNAARLGVAAPWLLLAVLATKPETIAAYDSQAGTALILVGVAVSFAAYRLMVALGRLPEERRWFR